MIANVYRYYQGENMVITVDYVYLPVAAHFIDIVSPSSNVLF
jgi:hypothetical protein